MSRPLRNTDPEAIRLITSRTVCASLFMVPTEMINRIIGSVLAKCQHKYQLDIFGFCFMSNHFHILCRAPHRNVCFFFQEFKKEVAVRINMELGREGFFWHRRYDDQACQTLEDALEALAYIITNPIKHKLVDRVQNWPGLNSYQQMLDNKPRTYDFISHTKKSAEYKRAAAEGRAPRPEAYTTSYKLELTPLPSIEKLLKGRTITEIIEERVGNLRKEQNYAPVLGRKRILKQNPFSVPKEVSKSARPMCYTKCVHALKAFHEAYQSWRDAYIKASEKFRNGFLHTIFPPESMKPPLLYMYKNQQSLAVPA